MRQFVRFHQPDASIVNAQTIVLVNDRALSTKHSYGWSDDDAADHGFVDQRVGEVEVLDVLGPRQLGAGELVLMERVCFSDISACKRSRRS